MTRRLSYWLLAITLFVMLPSPLALAASGAGTGSVAGTLVFRGSMSSVATMTMTGAFSVGHATNIDWDLPLPLSMRLSGYRQRVDTVSYHFSVPPDSFQDVSAKGQLIRRFHWSTPPADTIIHVTEHLRLVVGTRLTPFRSAASYPLRSTPSGLTPYLSLTSSLRLPASTQPLLHGFRRPTEQAVVGAVADWVASHVQYSSAREYGPFAAAWVLAHHEATCRGYVNIMSAMLRYLGIPTQIVYGWVAAAPVGLPGPHGSSSFIQWGTPGSPGTLHTWLNIYFPGTGWVPFDPQREKYFIDPRHLVFGTATDTDALRWGAWSAQAVGGLAATGQKLANGDVEIVPGDPGSSHVTVRTADSFHVSFQGLRHDVANVLLFSR